MKRTKDFATDSASIPPPNQRSALLLVDPQNDFFPGAVIGNPDSSNLIPIINTYIQYFSRNGFPILATRDWHPPNHCSFTEHGGHYPTHCVQGSRGAQFHSDLVMPPGMMVISKGTDPRKDARSAFDGSSLADRLEDLNVKTVFALGPATEDCLKQTVLDASNLGFQVVILKDGIVMEDTADSFNEISKVGTLTLQATASDLGLSLG